jgi:hypothetical protein
LAHRTVRCATGHVRCTRETSRLNSSLSGISSGDSAIIHRTVRCTPDMSGAPRKSRLRNSPASGFHLGCFAKIHRTVRCTPDCPVPQRGNGYFQRQRLPAAHLLRASARRGQARPCWRTGHSTVHVRCATGHPGGPRRQSSNGRPNGYMVTWLGHRTVRCTIRQTAPATVKFGGWGYKYPNHPTIHCIQVFQLQPLYKS